MSRDPAYSSGEDGPMVKSRYRDGTFVGKLFHQANISSAPFTTLNAAYTYTAREYDETIQTVNSIHTQNNCSHRRTDFRFLPGPYVYTYNQPGTYNYSRGTHTYPRAVVASPNMGAHTPLPVLREPPVDLTLLHKKAMDAMYPTMKTKLSLSNFIWELGDINKMFRVHSLAKNLWNSRYKKLSRVKNLKKLLNDGHDFAHDTNLGINFGWKPFIADCKNLAKGIMSFEERYAKFIGRQEVWNTAHYGKSLEVDPYVSEAPIGTVGPGWVQRETTEWKNVAYHASMKYKYTLPKFSSGFRRASAWLDTLGLHISPAVIWEAIPYSFVIDWFVGVGDALKACEGSYSSPHMTIDNMVYSLKYNYTSTWECRAPQDYESQPYGQGSVESTKYYCRCVMPPQLQLITVDGDALYDPSKISLGSSLFYNASKRRSPRD